MRRLSLLVSAIVFFETIFFAALAPLLPHFTNAYGLSKAGAGLLTAAYAVGLLVGAVPGGMLATRLGVKPTVVVGLVVMSTSSVAFGLAGTVLMLDAARFGQGVGGALAWTGGLAWLVAAAPRDQRGEFLGIAIGAAGAGAMLGPLLGGVAAVTGTEVAFTAVALLCIVLAVCACTMPAFGPRERQPLRSLLAAMRDIRILGGIWLLVLPGLLLGVLSVLAPLSLDRVGWGAASIGGVFLIAAGVEASFNPALGRWSDRRGRLEPLRVALIASIAVSIVLPWIDTRWPLAVLVVTAGITYGVFWVPATALLSDGAERVGLDQALSFALMNLASSPGLLLGSAGSGALAGATGDAAPYLLLAVVCLLTLTATHRWLRT